MQFLHRPDSSQAKTAKQRAEALVAVGRPLGWGVVDGLHGEEIKFIDEIHLWDVVPRPNGVKVIDTRWVDVNKGDETEFQVRSRLVAKEIKRKGMVEQYFAAMPPLAPLPPGTNEEFEGNVDAANGYCATSPQCVQPCVVLPQLQRPWVSR